MAKTSMFGGLMAPEVQAPHAIQMTGYLHSSTGAGVANNTAIEADSCMTINGSSVCQSPSPTNKAQR